MALRPEPRRGFTLVELAVALSLLGLGLGLTLPWVSQQLLRAGRLDAVQALQALQTEQERFRLHHGDYAAELTPLHGVQPRSTQGRYRIELQRTGPEAYTARATAQGRQGADRDCPALELQVQRGFARQLPGPACWNR